MYSCCSAHEPVGPAHQDLKVDVRPQAHVLSLELKDLNEALLHGDAHVELAVEPDRPVYGLS